MSEAVLEIVEFRTSGDFEHLYQAARNLEQWLQEQRGFRWRRLSLLEDGRLVDAIEWAGLSSNDVVQAS